jgi:AP-3 complex subunit mu
MVDIFDEYFSETTEGVVKDNFVTIFQLLDELVDNGFPFTTEPNILKEMIPPPGLVSRVLQAVTGSSTLSGVLPAGSLSNIPYLPNFFYNFSF